MGPARPCKLAHRKCTPNRPQADIRIVIEGTRSALMMSAMPECWWVRQVSKWESYHKMSTGTWRNRLVPCSADPVGPGGRWAPSHQTVLLVAFVISVWASRQGLTLHEALEDAVLPTPLHRFGGWAVVSGVTEVEGIFVYDGMLEVNFFLAMRKT